MKKMNLFARVQSEINARRAGSGASPLVVVGADVRVKSVPYTGASGVKADMHRDRKIAKLMAAGLTMEEALEDIKEAA